MREYPEWMTNTDYLLLLALGSSDLVTVFSPAILAVNLGMSREHASRRLSALAERGFVVRIEDGKYELGPNGKSFLNGGATAGASD